MDNDFYEIVQQVLEEVKKTRNRLPRINSDNGINNWLDLDCSIKLMEYFIAGRSIDWFSPHLHSEDSDSFACYYWLKGESNFYGEDYLE